MLKYLAFKLGVWFWGPMPVRLGYFVSDRLGDASYLLGWRTRKLVVRNMRQVLGQGASQRQVKRSTRLAFQSLARNYYDLFRLPGLDLEKLNTTLALYKVEYFEDALAGKKGVIIATAHMGNFDLVVQVLAHRTHRLTVPVEPIEPKRLFRLVAGLRSSKGLSFLPTGIAGLRAAVRALKQGEIVAVACDRDINKNGCKLKFMGRQASFPTGAIELALKTGAPVIPAFAVREPHDRFSIHMEPPLEMKTEGSYDEMVTENMRRLVAIIENYVKAHPEQWVAAFDSIWDNQGQGQESASEPACACGKGGQV